ncbi:YihY/virulence factor BrkB family protein [Mycobacterium sp. MYCO198283]|uniref:YihY/virulence factor BrkB family protein n=1 Tax=Mycobacterium sp. MYCO198283 TaxID=2883505 RepID=UPI001E5C5850|nr:YhjD/YihY/BrkB family envelope integrity protein [Mycobacterium sp. MYCO198283]MCG5434430.1 YihY/virulence factor BrkB family protein [Mycobacterium sp. MYCO198283]
MVGWLDRLQRRSRAAGFVIAVVYKYADDQGYYLAALIAYYAFLSLFPLLLLLTTVLGLVLADRPDLQEAILDSALAQFPVIGSQLGQPRQLSGGASGVAIGIALALYGGLGAGQATQNAMATVWAVPRSSRPDPIRSRLRSLLLLLVLGSALLGTTLLAAVGRASSAVAPAKVGLIAAALLINTAVCAVAFRVATPRRLAFREILPGAVCAALVWQLLQWFGAVYVGNVVRGASVTNSIFALVLGLLAFLYLVAVSLVLTAELNAVRVNRLYPRALLTPFTDDVDLTAGDRRTYAGLAKAQQAKGFERVKVSFEKGDGPAAPER